MKISMKFIDFENETFFLSFSFLLACYREKIAYHVKIAFAYTLNVTIIGKT